MRHDSFSPPQSATWLRDLRGLSQLSVDGAVGVTDVVESLHATIQSLTAPLGKSKPTRTQGMTGLVYRAVRAGMAITGSGINAALSPLQAVWPYQSVQVTRDRYLSILNGSHGDHLARTGNPLAISMSLRRNGVAIDLSAPQQSLADQLKRPPRPKLILCLHGLCMNDHQWTRDGYSHGEMLAELLHGDALYLHYNSGLPIHQNGQALSAHLQTIMQTWHGELPEIVLICHSMGGLVARSACHHAQSKSLSWLQNLKHMVFLGTPHHGAPLERAGALIDLSLGISPYAAPSAKLGQSRSTGIQDLRYGKICSEQSVYAPALPISVRSYAVAATLDPIGQASMDAFIGDGLVPVDSALGKHADQRRDLSIPKTRQAMVGQCGHLALLWDQNVARTLQRWLQAAT